ncbi:hypothetical protein D9M70_557130 [compost metagenome]
MEIRGADAGKFHQPSLSRGYEQTELLIEHLGVVSRFGLGCRQRQPALADLKRFGHYAADSIVGRVDQSGLVTHFMEQDREQIEASRGRAATDRLPLTVDKAVLLVILRREIDEPAPSRGVAVDPDCAEHGFGQSVALEIDDLQIDRAKARQG